MAPFTYEQAQEICEDFEDLEGTELVIRSDKPIKYEVDHVCMCPFAEEDKSIFLQAYQLSHDPQKAISTYTGTDYDVLIIGHNIADKNEPVIQTITDYIMSNGVRYNFPA